MKIFSRLRGSSKMNEEGKNRFSFFKEYGDLLFLLVVSFLCYGLLIPWLGYYWDDWAFLWIANKLGQAGLIKYFIDTPVYEVVVRITTSLLGTTPWVWQVFGIMARWISAVAFWWLIRLCWPIRKSLALWGGLLFLVFPGFLMQFIPINFGHFFIFVTFFLLSLCFNLLAIRKRKWFWAFTPIALIFSFLNLAGWENYFVLELMRPFFLWFVLQENNQPRKHSWKPFFINWSPYLVLLIILTLWRAFFFPEQTVRYQFQLLDLLKTDPLKGIGQFFSSLLTGIYNAFIGGWAQAFRLPDIAKLGRNTTIVYTVLIAASLVLLLGFSFLTGLFKQKPGRQGEKNFPLQLILVGGFSLLIAGEPYILINQPVTLSFPNDRFLVSYMPGTVLLLLGLIYLISKIGVKFRNVPAIIFIVLIAFSIGTQFENANDFRRAWSFQTRLYWQLVWRVPALQPGTLILVNEFTGQFLTDNSVTSPVNWIYAPDYQGGNLPYDVFFPTIRLGTDLPELTPGLPIHHVYRPVPFVGNTSQIITLTYNPPGCLRVLDPQLDSVNAMLTPLMREAATVSSTSQILTSGTPALPVNIFGTEPAPNWCYYFEKADLARQEGDWAQVVELGEKAFSLSDFPNDPSERTPFIEGYAHQGNWTRALELTGDSAGVTPLMQPVLCNLWNRIDVQTPTSSEKADALSQVSTLLSCPTP